MDFPRAVAPVVLGVLAGLFLLGGLSMFLSAKSAVHEIEGLVSLLVAAVLTAGAVVSYGLYRLRLDYWHSVTKPVSSS